MELTLKGLILLKSITVNTKESTPCVPYIFLSVCLSLNPITPAMIPINGGMKPHPNRMADADRITRTNPPFLRLMKSNDHMTMIQDMMADKMQVIRKFGIKVIAIQPIQSDKGT